MESFETKKEHIKSEIDDLESDLSKRMDKIKEQITSTLSAQKLIDKYPLHSLGAAVIAGFLLANKTGRGSKKDRMLQSKISFTSLVTTEIKRQAAKKLVEYVTKKLDTLE